MLTLAALQLIDCVQNAFAGKLGQAGFDLFPMLVVDLMHEVESGVWRTIFIHLVRMLDTVGATLVNTLDER